jgi:response regulator RpfG family c-di-GMP phosphodiesterase
MDYNLPEGKATDLIKSLKQQGLRFPIVISTGGGSERLVVELMQLGVQDYLTKDDLSPAVLLRTLRNAMTTFQLESEIYYRAHFDGLTSLANRVTFMVRLREAVEQAERYQRRICCSMLMWITLNKSTMPMVMNGVTTYSRRWLNDCVHALDKRTSLRVSEVMSLCFCFTRLMCAKAF